MELDALKNMWAQYDNHINTNTHINREILKQLLKSKPEKRVNWMKIKAMINLVLPIVAIVVFLVPNLVFRNTIGFYVGATLFGIFATLTYYWAIIYYSMIRQIDFSAPIFLLKKRVAELSKFRLKVISLSFVMAPFAMAGIFMLAQMPVFTQRSVFPFALIVLTMAVSIFLTKQSVQDQFKKLNHEIAELEEVETTN